MSNNKENPTPIDAEVQAKATADLEEAISKELNIEDEEKQDTEVPEAVESLFTGGTTLSEQLSNKEGFSDAIPPHTILGVPYNEIGGRPPNEDSE